jgi:hypothetical protein
MYLFSRPGSRRMRIGIRRGLQRKWTKCHSDEYVKPVSLLSSQFVHINSRSLKFKLPIAENVEVFVVEEFLLEPRLLRVHGPLVRVFEERPMTITNINFNFDFIFYIYQCSRK